MTGTTVTVDYDCGAQYVVPVALAPDQLGLANAPLIDTIAALAEAWHERDHPDCTGYSAEAAGRAGAGTAMNLVIVDRVGHKAPRYEVAGHTQCVRCGAWVVLGRATLAVVQQPGMTALCLPCSHKLIREGTMTTAQRVARVVDPATGDPPP